MKNIYLGIIVGFLTLPSIVYAWSPCDPVFAGEDASGIFHNLLDILIYVALVVGWLSLIVAICFFVFSLFRLITLKISLGRYIKQILVGVIIFLILIVGAQLTGLSDDKKASDWFDCFGGEEKVREQAEDLKGDVVANAERKLKKISEQSEIDAGSGHEEDAVIDEIIDVDPTFFYNSKKDRKRQFCNMLDDHPLDYYSDELQVTDKELKNRTPPLYRTIELESYELIPFLSPSAKRIVKMIGKDITKHATYEMAFLATEEGRFEVEKVYTQEKNGSVSISLRDFRELIDNPNVSRVIHIHNHPFTKRMLEPPSLTDVTSLIGNTYYAREKDKEVEVWVMAPEGMYVIKSLDTNANLEYALHAISQGPLAHTYTKETRRMMISPYAKALSAYRKVSERVVCIGEIDSFHKLFDAADALRIDLSFYTYDQLLNTDVLDQWDEDHMSRGRTESIKSLEEAIKDIEVLLP